MYGPLRKGFTVVELMIVMVIVTAFASAIMIIASEMSSTARASKIITNLHNLKMAAMILIDDKKGEYSKLTTSELSNRFQTNKQSEYIISKYIERGLDAPDSKNYLIMIRISDPGSGSWYVRYDSSNESERVRQKLAGQTKKTGLEGDDEGTLSNLQSYTGQKYAALKIIESINKLK